MTSRHWPGVQSRKMTREEMMEMWQTGEASKKMLLQQNMELQKLIIERELEKCAKSSDYADRKQTLNYRCYFCKK